MSTIIYSTKQGKIKFELAQFYGGDKKRECIQLSIDDCFIQLNKEQVINLVETLVIWLK